MCAIYKFALCIYSTCFVLGTVLSNTYLQHPLYLHINSFSPHNSTAQILLLLLCYAEEEVNLEELISPSYRTTVARPEARFW